MYGTAAPRPTTSEREKTLLFSSVSATVPVASAVAVRVTPPLVAVQVPVTATVALSPGAMAGVVPWSAVVPAERRVTVPAGTVAVPRFWTATVKETAAPTAGADGLAEMPVTFRSGPGLWVTVSFVAAVRLLLPLSCSATVSVGSTTAETVYAPIGRRPTATATVVDAPAGREATGADPATAPSTLTFTEVAAAGALPELRTVAFTVTVSASDGVAGVQVRSVRTRSGLGAAVPRTWTSATWAPGAPVLEEKASRRSAYRPVTGTTTVLAPEDGLKE